MTTISISICLGFNKTIPKDSLFIGQAFNHWRNLFTCHLIDMTRYQLFIEVCHITFFRRLSVHKTILRNIFFSHIPFFTRYQVNTCCFIHKTCDTARASCNHTVHLRGHFRRFSRFFQDAFRHLIRVTVIFTITISVTSTCQAIGRCY